MSANRPHDHAHRPSLARAGERHRRPLAISFALIAGFFVVEAVAGFATGSLALLSDAGHMLTDVVGLGMALAAIQLATRFGTNGRPAESRHTFGVYRLEILAAFVNALLLVGVAIWVVVEAIRRLFEEPEVLGVPMLVVAALGLIVNVVAFVLLREGAAESVNVEGAYLEVLADTIGSIGVIIAAIMLAAVRMDVGRSGRGGPDRRLDPAAHLAAGSPSSPDPRAGRPGRDRSGSAHDRPRRDRRRRRRPRSPRLDPHLRHGGCVGPSRRRAGTDHHAVLDQARHLLADRYGIAHGTFQVEPDTHEGCHDVTW